jgi:hypothetical protein
MSSGASIGAFVLGMHRSGTSATTRAINLLGVPLAKEDELSPPSPNNPTGFWEVTRLTEFNNKLLYELGGSSLGPPPLEDGWATRPELARRRRRARSLFSKAHTTDSWAWKDPRNCVLLPFWREALEVRPVVVLVHRDPAEIARSLERRQGLSAAMALATWERYLRAALRATEALPVFVTRYRDLVEAPGPWASELGWFLRDHGLPSEPDAGGERVAEFIRSSRPDDGDARGRELSNEQRELLTAIETVAGPHDAFAPPALPAETESTEPLIAERRRADVLRQQMDERLRSTRRRLREARAAQEQAEERLDELQQAGGGRATLLGRRRPAAAERVGRLPDFLIIGAQKCGTSSLFRYLGESPHVELPTAKEVHFFDVQFDRGPDWYRAQFPAPASAGVVRRRSTITGEASPYYLFHPLAARRVKEVLPEVRLLALLRNPVHRAVSHYYHELGNGFEELPLPVALDRERERLEGEAERIAADPGYEGFNHRHFSYQARGVYADQLAVWRSLFPDDQLLVINSDQLFEDPYPVMERVYDFLDLPGRPARDLGAYNQRDYPSMSDEIEARLTAHFAGHNARLYEFTGEDFGWPAVRDGSTGTG